MLQTRDRMNGLLLRQNPTHNQTSVTADYIITTRCKHEGYKSVKARHFWAAWNL